MTFPLKLIVGGGRKTNQGSLPLDRGMSFIQCVDCGVACTRTHCWVRNYAMFDLFGLEIHIWNIQHWTALFQIHRCQYGLFLDMPSTSLNMSLWPLGVRSMHFIRFENQPVQDWWVGGHLSEWWVRHAPHGYCSNPRRRRAGLVCCVLLFWDGLLFVKAKLSLVRFYWLGVYTKKGPAWPFEQFEKVLEVVSLLILYRRKQPRCIHLILHDGFDFLWYLTISLYQQLWLILKKTFSRVENLVLLWDLPIVMGPLACCCEAWAVTMAAYWSGMGYPRFVLWRSWSRWLSARTMTRCQIGPLSWIMSGHLVGRLPAATAFHLAIPHTSCRALFRLFHLSNKWKPILFQIT